MRGKARQLAAELTALGMEAQVTGRSVRAWMPDREGCVVAVTPVRIKERGTVLARRMWSWRQECGGGRPLRAGTRGAAVGVAGLLLRLAGEPGRQPVTGTRGRHPRPVALVAYGAAAGLIAAALGAFAASPLSGTARTIAWLAVTAVLAVVAVRLGEWAVAAVTRLFHPDRPHSRGGAGDLP